MGSDLEGNLGPEGDLHDGGWSDGRRVGGGGTESRGEGLVGASRSGTWRVDGDGWNLGNGREGGGVEGGDGDGEEGGDASGSRLRSGWWGEESGRNRADERTTPAGSASSLPTLFSDGAESRDLNVTIFINRHLGKLLSE